ncbi:nuclear transport factor 2 family protein [Amycolatopsis sp. OK19-0408]|uniref:Nuclear transport factor 2 family protein n=1 Tax=Amycolatopsis iheyensis TaxID=2945988 RepID=A0A9X2NM70_9PSEU|nr:nuclear transport factor 2 family protein [Amycolatopsis iheyensis]MCR6487380.1 nuclear transport factor 2 family protein [Amycolatopsis iheyensis]
MNATDRLDVIEACDRFGWYADRRDWAAMTDLLADEVCLDYRALHGGDAATVTGAAAVAGWTTEFAAFRTTQHLIGNHVVALEGDTATCDAQVQATHVPAHGGPPWVLGGHYRMRLRRAGAGWRIAAVTFTPDWQTGVVPSAGEAGSTRATAQAWFDRVCDGAVAEAADLLGDDVEWVNFVGVPGHHDCMPWIGTYHGPAAVLASFEAFTSVCDVRHKELRRLVVDGDQAVGVVHEKGVARGTGVAFEIEYVETLTVRDGRIVRWKSYTDPCSIIRALRF